MAAHSPAWRRRARATHSDRSDAVAGWWQRWRDWRQSAVLQRRPIPDDLWRDTLARFPFLMRLSPLDQTRLREHATLFLADKEFTGAHGLPVTDEMAVAIAAQACLPVLRLGLDHYAGFKGIVVHADSVVARRQITDEVGIVHEYDETLSGEAMQGGPVMLSWADVADAGESAQWGYNVVIHEFVHVLDMRDGLADGVPVLGSRAARTHWLQVMQAGHQRFCRQLDAGHSTLLDPYGAQGLEEFFAVAAEAFFVSPMEFRDEHPHLHALLADYFQLDLAD